MAAIRASQPVIDPDKANIRLQRSLSRLCDSNATGNEASVVLDRSVALPFIVRFLDGLVHPSAAADRVHAARHRSFIAVHFGAALIALAVLPLSLALSGPISLAEAALFGWLVLPMAIAVYLSRTGRLEIAHLLSATVLTCLIVWLAGVSGGLKSMALAWLAVVPFVVCTPNSVSAIGSPVTEKF